MLEHFDTGQEFDQQLPLFFVQLSSPLPKPRGPRLLSIKGLRGDLFDLKGHCWYRKKIGVEGVDVQDQYDISGRVAFRNPRDPSLQPTGTEMGRIVDGNTSPFGRLSKLSFIITQRAVPSFAIPPAPSHNPTFHS